MQVGVFPKFMQVGAFPKFMQVGTFHFGAVHLVAEFLKFFLRFSDFEVADHESNISFALSYQFIIG